MKEKKRERRRKSPNIYTSCRNGGMMGEFLHYHYDLVSAFSLRNMYYLCN